MGRALRLLMATVLAVAGSLMTAGLARAGDITNSSGNNVQSGNNRSTGTQSGTSKSGAAVGGQVTGVVSSGRTSVDATNKSTNSDVTSGDARGGNTANTFTGLNDSGPVDITADITGSRANNLQDGDNRTTYNQSATYTTGDGVAGEVIGAVTAAGGSASIVAANTSTDDSVQTGDARGDNAFASFTGLNDSNALDLTADISNSCTTSTGPCSNVQSGNNRTTGRQLSTASTGDGIAGQVVGAVSGGATSIDARNTSDGVDVTTGDARSDNSSALFTGLNDSGNATITAGTADITNSCSSSSGCGNVQDGNNTTNTNQNAAATTGDGVGGQVIGAVTSAGGSASVVAANTSKNSDITTGDATSANDLGAFVGLNFPNDVTVGDITGSCNTGSACANLQDGTNRLTGSQTATSATGDGVGGQVLGLVSAGAASLDASNTTDDSSVQTGDSKANNDAGYFVGLNDAGDTTIADITGARATNLQDGSNRKTFTQTANATSGDGVAGQVSGVVTSAGGSASVVLANTSTGIDSLSGDSNFNNDDAGFVGLNDSSPITIGGGAAGGGPVSG